MTMLASIMGIWIIASIISSSPGLQTGADDKNLGRLAKFSSEEATFNDNVCKNPKYSLHPKDHDARRACKDQLSGRARNGISEPIRDRQSSISGRNLRK